MVCDNTCFIMLVLYENFLLSELRFRSCLYSHYEMTPYNYTKRCYYFYARVQEYHSEGPKFDLNLHH